MEVYRDLRKAGFQPNAFTVVSLLKALRNDGVHPPAFEVSALLMGTTARRAADIVRNCRD